MNRKDKKIINYGGYSLHLYTTRSNYTTIEHAAIYKNMELLSHGRYCWLNRSWQSGQYHNAIINACNNLNIDYNGVISQL